VLSVISVAARAAFHNINYLLRSARLIAPNKLLRHSRSTQDLKPFLQSSATTTGSQLVPTSWRLAEVSLRWRKSSAL